MPPVRSMPPAKPVKTERTHEENQERAYIAASRRSDRSLEARVESARRASEIHKRRTGRSLRVTEQDVVNEEMYEEEDDDLPMQYRRLTAHLQTSNAEFDRRLQSYLAHQMGMRAPLMGNGNAQFDPSLGNMQLSSRQFMNPNMMQMSPFPMQNHMQQSPTVSRPTNYRQAPYPAYGMRPNSHARSASIATPQELTNWYQHQPPTMQTPAEQPKADDRRMSVPVQNVVPPHTPTSLDGRADPSHGSPPTVSRSASSTNLSAPRNGRHSQSPQQQTTPPIPTLPVRHASYAGPFYTGAPSSGQDTGPLTAALPLDSQQMLAFNPSDFSLGNLQQDPWDMKPQQPFYSYNPNGKSRQSASFAESQGGMHQTLAPASHLPTSLDTSMNPADFSSLSSATTAANSATSPFDTFDFGAPFDPSFGIDPLKMSNNGSNSTGHLTPGEADWASFVDGGAFEEASVT
ncbi:hypothetical protein K431DRAFT_307638 [Polychaeton citri CBS 116435]|uniref:Uncharacterized protein n=1 Tax=Polychaeton citri CBS 116435 TaxID=1314669 RepID=A0A9P4PX88_9PEZI|nr:hypothetical protein K431DRAFT_307638 [Polychaeton citri CBS 116435]